MWSINPLSQNELYELFPNKVENLKEFETKLMITAEQDMERFQQHKINKKLQEEQENEIQARQIVPKSDNFIQ